MHHFKKLSLEDQDLYEKTIQTCPLYQTYDASELIFLNLLAWSTDECIEIMWKDGIGYIRCLKHGEVWFFPPIAATIEDFTKGVYFIKTRFPDCRLIGITEEMKKLIPFENALFLVDDKLSEYLYEPKAFIEMKGQAYHRKRNLIAQFKKTYDYQFLTYEKAMRPKIDDLLKRYLAQGGSTDDFVAFHKALDLFEMGLAYEIYLLLVDDIAVGVSVVVKSYSNNGIVQFEKADTSYSGAYQMLAHQTALKSMSNCRFINRQEDLGYPELRRAKLSYHPYVKDLKYAVYFRAFTKQVYELYRMSFPEDSKPYVDYFFLNHYQEKNLRYAFDDHQIKASFHIKMNRYKVGRRELHIPMIVAAATHPHFRRQGYMKLLLLRYIAECEKNNIPWIVLKTDKPEVYQGLGFVGVGHEERIGDYDRLEDCHIEQTGNMELFSRIYETRFKEVAHDIRDITYYQDLVYALAMDGYEAYVIKKDKDIIGYVIENDLFEVEEMVLLKKVNPIVKNRDYSDVYVPSETGRHTHMLRITHLPETLKIFKNDNKTLMNLSVDGHLHQNMPARIMVNDKRFIDNFEKATHVIDRDQLTEILFNEKPHEDVHKLFTSYIMTFINAY